MFVYVCGCSQFCTDVLAHLRFKQTVSSWFSISILVHLKPTSVVCSVYEWNLTAQMVHMLYIHIALLISQYYLRTQAFPCFSTHTRISGRPGRSCDVIRRGWRHGCVNSPAHPRIAVVIVSTTWLTAWATGWRYIRNRVLICFRLHHNVTLSLLMYGMGQSSCSVYVKSYYHLLIVMVHSVLGLCVFL